MRRRHLSDPGIEREYILKHVDEQPVQNITMEAFYRPHTITLLLLVCVTIAFSAYRRDPNLPLEKNLLDASLAIIFVFLLISTMVLPNGIFTRPHPVVWRLVLGASIIYLLLIIGACFLSYGQVQKILYYLYPDLKTMDSSAILSREYGVNCNEITFERIWSDVDIFVIAHFCGWIVKALLLRHYVVLWVLSINWEITELAFSHILPNLNECWWDSLIFDVLICNGLGIHIGWMLCKWLEVREYKWESYTTIKSVGGKVKRIVMQFTPVAWTPTQWYAPGSSFHRGLMLSALTIIWQLVELNSFLLKHVFVVKPSHPLTLGRLFLITLSSAPAIRQYYHLTVNTQVNRLGSQLFVFLAILVAELLVCLRLGSEHFERTIMINIVYWIIWMVVSSFLTVYLCMYLANKNPVIDEPRRTKKERLMCRRRVRLEENQSSSSAEDNYVEPIIPRLLKRESETATTSQSTPNTSSLDSQEVLNLKKNL